MEEDQNEALPAYPPDPEAERSPDTGQAARLSEALARSEARCERLYRAAAERAIEEGLLRAGADERALPLLARLVDPAALTEEDGLPVFGGAGDMAAAWPFLFPGAEPVNTARVTPPVRENAISADRLRALSAEDINRCWGEVSAALRSLHPNEL